MRTLESILDIDKSDDKITETVVLGELAKCIRNGDLKTMQWKMEKDKGIALLEDWCAIVKPIPPTILKHVDILAFYDGGAFALPKAIGGKTVPDELWIASDVDIQANTVQKLNIVSGENVNIGLYDFTSKPTVKIMSDVGGLHIDLNSWGGNDLSGIECTGAIDNLHVVFEEYDKFYDLYNGTIVKDPVEYYNIKAKANNIFFGYGKEVVIKGQTSKTAPRSAGKYLGKYGKYHYYEIND